MEEWWERVAEAQQMRQEANDELFADALAMDKLSLGFGTARSSTETDETNEGTQRRCFAKIDVQCDARKEEPLEIERERDATFGDDGRTNAHRKAGAEFGIRDPPRTKIRNPTLGYPEEGPRDSALRKFQHDDPPEQFHIMSMKEKFWKTKGPRLS